MRKLFLLLPLFLLASCEGSSYSSNISDDSVHSHILVKVEQKEPTCINYGNDEYYKCEVCDAVFADNVGKEQLSHIPFIDPLGHIEDQTLHCSRCKELYRPSMPFTLRQLDYANRLNYIFNNDNDLSNPIIIHPSETKINISKSGVYFLSGIYENSVHINKGLEKVTIILSNVKIVAANEPAIESSSNLTIYLAYDTSNVLTTNDDLLIDSPALFVNGELTICGKGKLTINGTYKNGIDVENGKLNASDCHLDIDVNSNGIKAGAFHSIDSHIKINVKEKDGINVNQASNVKLNEHGTIYLNNADIDIICAGDGIEANSFICIKESLVKIKTTTKYVVDSEENRRIYKLTGSDFRYLFDGTNYVKVASDRIKPGTNYYALTQSGKGIKNNGSMLLDDMKSLKPFIYIDSSTIDISSADDSLNSKNGDLLLINNKMNVISSDDGLTSSHINYINGGTYDIKSFEGVEGTYVNIVNGIFDIHTTDDAINAGNNDITTFLPLIRIEGGTLKLDPKNGDGIDSNGDIYVSGGDIRIRAETQEAIDSNNGTYIDGGNIIGASMTQIIDRASSKTQIVPVTLINASFWSGQAIEILVNDVVIIDITPKVTAYLIYVSVEQLSIDDILTIRIDGGYYYFNVEDILNQYPLRS